MLRRSRQLYVLTTNTLLEALRNKTIYVVLVAAALTMGAATVFGALSLHQDERVFNNLLFFAGMLFLAALAIYQGVTTIHREIDSNTIFTVLSKPVTRGSFLIGKYIASITLVAICTTLMFGLKTGVAIAFGYDVTASHLGAYFAGYLQLTMIIAIAFFFSAFSTSGPLLSALFTFAIFVIGSLTPQLEGAADKFAADGNPIHVLLETALHVIPDFEKLNLSYELTHGMEIPPSYYLHACGYAATVVIFALLFAHLIFSRRDFS